MFADGVRNLSSSTALLFANGDALYGNWEITALTYSDSQLTRKEFLYEFSQQLLHHLTHNANNRDLTDYG